MKILIVDDHAIVREGIRRFLGSEIEATQFGTAASSQEALELVRRETWDIVTLDLALAGRSGLETLTDIHAVRPGLPVLVLTVWAEPHYALRAFRAGAAGYMTKGGSLEDLVIAVRRVAGGGKYVTPNVAEQLATTLHDAHGRRLDDALSDREFQVLGMLGSGKSVKEIGIALALSPKTVSTYRTRILDKLHMRTTAQLVRYALGHGLAEPDVGVA
jgi:two-component system, NarL family, invasion response regulator UvrY